MEAENSAAPVVIEAENSSAGPRLDSPQLCPQEIASSPCVQVLLQPWTLFEVILHGAEAGQASASVMFEVILREAEARLAHWPALGDSMTE